MATTKSRPHVALISLGCPKNLVDSEVIVGRLGQACRIVVDPGEADVALVNTCGFIDAARAESRAEIDDLLRLKRAGVLRGVIVAGCLVKRFRAQLERDFPEVDAFLDISDYSDVAAAVRGIMRGHDVAALRGGRVKEAATDLGRVLLTPEHFAYLRVSEGCNYQCSFCVIPQIRGRLRSKPLRVLEEEARQLAELGVKEVALVGEDTTAYGRDLGLQDGLVELLRRLGRVGGIEWIRLLYTHPLSLSLPIIDELVTNAKVVPYLDMPIQHADDGVLRAMRRGTPRALLESRIAELRRRSPEIALRTTVIVGFPGETAEAFATLLDFLADIRFARLGCFTYSAEAGSGAAGLPDDVPPEVKDERRDLVMRRQLQITEERNQSLEGRTVGVILDRRQGHELLGRTEADAPDIDGSIRLAGPGDPGQIRKAVVTGHDGYDLCGELVEEAPQPAPRDETEGMQAGSDAVWRRQRAIPQRGVPLRRVGGDH
ncbi:MAG: 30S ribosomal protein S12 methylthiotransferase RimO [Planctomycetota bacterium]